MKCISILLLFLCVTTSAQTRLIKRDTLKGVDTVRIVTDEIKSSNFFTYLQIDFEQITGSSTNDSVWAQASGNGKVYYNIAHDGQSVFGFPNTKGAIKPYESGGGMLINMSVLPNPYYAFYMIGVAGDTTIYEVSYGTKK